MINVSRETFRIIGPVYIIEKDTNSITETLATLHVRNERRGIIRFMAQGLSIGL